MYGLGFILNSFLVLIQHPNFERVHFRFTDGGIEDGDAPRDHQQGRGDRKIKNEFEKGLRRRDQAEGGN